MNKLVCLCAGFLVLSLSLMAMDADVNYIKLDTTSPVDYILPLQSDYSLKGRSLRKCIDALLSEKEYSNTLLELVEGIKDHSDMMKEALIDDYLVVLCELFKEELPVTELDYYKPREFIIRRQPLTRDYEGVAGAVLTRVEDEEGIVFLSYRKEEDQEQPGVYLDYWFLGDLTNDEIKEKKPRCQRKIGIIPIRDGNIALRMDSELYANRFIIICGADCQLVRLAKEGFEQELRFTFCGDFQLSPDGRKVAMRGYCNADISISNFITLFEDIEILKSRAVGTILDEAQLKSFGVSGKDCFDKDKLRNFGVSGDDVSYYKIPLMDCYDWSSAGIIALAFRGAIELRDMDNISQIEACFGLSEERLSPIRPRSHLQKFRYGGFRVIRILANGMYLLCVPISTSVEEEVWLIDTVKIKAEPIVRVTGRSDLRTSYDGQFAILTRDNRNPLLCDLQRKISAEIMVGSKEELLAEYHIGNCQKIGRMNLMNSIGARSTYLTSHNDILLFLLDRRVRFVCLKSALKAKSLRELVDGIKKRNAIMPENTHHQHDGE